MIIIFEFHNHRLMQFGRELRRSPTLPPAQSRANTKCRRGCSGICPARSCKTPRMELPQHLWEASSTPNYPPICSLNLPCSNLWSLSIIFLPSTYVSIFLLISLLILEIRLLLECPQNLFSKLNKLRPLSLSSQVIYSRPPAILVAFLPWIHSNLSARALKLHAFYQIHFYDCWGKVDNLFP